MVSNAFNLANVAVNTANSNASVTGFTANVAVGNFVNAANVQVTNSVLFSDGGMYAWDETIKAWMLASDPS